MRMFIVAAAGVACVSTKMMTTNVHPRSLSCLIYTGEPIWSWAGLVHGTVPRGLYIIFSTRLRQWPGYNRHELESVKKKNDALKRQIGGIGRTVSEKER